MAKGKEKKDTEIADGFLRVVFNTQFEANGKMQKLNDYFAPFMEKLQSRMSYEEFDEWEGAFLCCFTSAMDYCAVESMKMALDIVNGNYSMCY